MNTRWAILSSVLVLAVGGAALLQWQHHQGQNLQLLAYEQHVQKLLNDIETASVSRLETRKQVEQMGRTLSELRSQLAAVNSQLHIAQQQVNPEIAVIEERIRREVRNEMRAQAEPPTYNSRSDLLRKVTQLDPVELGELLSLQGTYGSFLQALDVDDDRFETIVDGLSNIAADQNQARMALLQQMQQDGADPRNFRRQMTTINNPAAQAEALSFILTEEELALFNAVQASQPQQTFARSIISVNDGTTTTSERTLFFTPGTGGGSTGTVNFEILPANPIDASQTPSQAPR